MKNTETTNHEDVTTRIDALVAALEALELEPWAEHATRAEQAIEAAIEPARARLFPPDVLNVSANAFAALSFYTERMGRDGLVQQLAALHARSLISHPDLATLLRSPEIMADVRAAAEARAAVLARDALGLGDEAVAMYETLIAQQLVAAAGHELAEDARVFLACTSHRARVKAAVEKHQARAAEELTRADEQRRAAHRARTQEAARRLAAANEEAARLRSEADAVQREARKVRAEGLIERLRDSGLPALDMGRESFRTAHMVEVMPGMSDQQLDRIEAALNEAGA